MTTVALRPPRERDRLYQRVGMRIARQTDFHDKQLISA